MSYPDCPRVSKAMHEHPRYQNTVTLVFALSLERDLNKTIALLKQARDYVEVTSRKAMDEDFKSPLLEDLNSTIKDLEAP